MKLRVLCLFLSFLAIFAGLAFSQQQDGSIIGSVKDSSGAVIPGATVELTGTKLIQPRVFVADDEGKFRFMAIPPGVYTVSASLEGFVSVKEADIQLNVGRTIKVDLVLSVGQIAETITVSANAPIDVVKTESAQILTASTLDQLPKGREYKSIVTINPGIMSESTGIQIDGASGSENTFIIDGLDSTNFFRGTSNIEVPFDFVEEVQIKTGGYEAEFGGAMGGVVAMVTKSGGNEFHGDFNYYFNSVKTQAGPRPRLRLNPADETKAEYTYDPQDQWTRHEIGVTAGGYILKDKLWFFGAFMPTFNPTHRDVTFTADNVTRGYDSHFTAYNVMGKLSSTLWQRLNISASYNLNWDQTRGSLPGYDGTANPDADWAGQGRRWPEWTTTMNVNYQPTATVMLDGKFGFYHSDNYQLNEAILQPFVEMWRDMPAGGVWDQVPANLRKPRGWSNYVWGSGRANLKNLEDRWQGSFDGSVYFNALGEHNVKAGYQFNRCIADTDNGFPNNWLRVYWNSTYISPVNNQSYTGTYGYLRIIANPAGGQPYGFVWQATSNRHAFFIQDSWRPVPKLTLNLGVRAEREDIPSLDQIDHPGTAIQFSFGQKLAPRLGAAYDVFGNSQFKIYGSYGIFYDVMKLALSRSSLGGDKWWDAYYTLESTDWEAMLNGNFTLGGGQFIEKLDRRFKSFDLLDPDMDPISGREITVGSEYLLNKDWVLGFRFIRKDLRKTIEDIGILRPVGEVYYIGNPGYGLSVSEFLKDGLPPTPKAKRTYTAFETTLNKRFSDNWRMRASYTYSRLRGNYSGLASSDEGGRQDPNVSRDFDLWFMNVDADNKPLDGPLQSDRPHVIKVDASYQFPWGLGAGIYQRFMSGTPLTRSIYYGGAEMRPLNRMSDGRLPLIYATDLYLTYSFKFKENYTVQFNMNVYNLFDQSRATSKLMQMNMDGFSADITPGQPWDWRALLDQKVQAGEDRYDPRFGMIDGYQAGLSARFGIRFIF